MRSAALALAAVLALASSTLAQPALPRRIRALPVYDATLGLRISWLERTGAEYYNLYRSVDDGPEVFVATFPSKGVDQFISYLDQPAVATSDYTYRVQACDVSGCSTSPPFTNSPRVVWPIVGGHEVMHGYNEVIGWAGIGNEPVLVDPGPPPKYDALATGYHMGVDLNKTTPAGVPGDLVVAPRGGFVMEVGTTEVDNGSIAIGVLVGGDKFEVDSFNHIATVSGAPSVAAGDVVAPGQQIARIGSMNGFIGNYAKHVHYMQERPAPLAAGEQRIIRHPLAVFTDDADRDPLRNPPAFFDENADGKIVLYREHATRTLIDYDHATTPLYGDVDVEPEVMDEQGADPRQAPIDLGYWIEGPLPDSEQFDDVKGEVHPYRLYDFRVEYFGGIPTTSPKTPPAPCDAVADIADDANAGCRGLANCFDEPNVSIDTCNSVVTEGFAFWVFPILHHFIVTHAKGETGARADVDRNQFWRTAAKDDGEPAGSTHANYAGRTTTTKAWEARFLDGDYTIHVVASDLVNTNVDLPLPPVRLENFAPFVKEIQIAQDADGNPANGEPQLPGCENVLRHYKHTPRRPYLDPRDVVVSTPTVIARTGQKLCVWIRFSEPVTSVGVDLIRERGAGTPVPGGGFAGALSTTYQDNDAWMGSVTLPADASGESDADPAGDERDAAIRIVAVDRRDGAGNTRGLDANADGVPDPGGDIRHIVKLDLTRPTGVLDVVKP